MLYDKKVKINDMISKIKDVELLKKIFYLVEPELNKNKGCTIVLVTHVPSIAAKTKRIIELVDGKIIKDTRNAK